MAARPERPRRAPRLRTRPRRRRHPAAVRTTITVPDSVSMVALLGSADELLRLVEAEVDADIHVRGNEIAVTGLPADNAFAVRVFDELIALLGTRQELRPDSVRRVIAMLQERRLGAAGRRAQPRHHQPPRPHDPAEDAEPEALRRRDRPEHDRLRHRARRYRQDLPRHGQGRAGAADQAGQPHHPDPAGRRGRRAARLPARHAQREDRPVPAAAVRRAARHGRPGVDPAADGGRDDRGRAAGLHAGKDLERCVRHSRRGAEHHCGTDEDVPHPARIRLQDRRHRRHHPGRPARRRAERPTDRPRDPRRHRGRALLHADQLGRRPAPLGR